MSSYITVTLDLSTNSTGYAVFCSKTKKPITYGVIKPKVPGLHKMQYPAAAYFKIKDVASKVKDLIAEHSPDVIVIEEINRGINRIAQKSLDALHFFVLDYLCLLDKSWIDKVVYVDSNGAEGWRGALGLKLSKEDKEKNKQIRKENKRSRLSYAPIDWKVLAERYVNSKFGTKFDVRNNPGDADVCDAIALGDAYLTKMIKS